MNEVLEKIVNRIDWRIEHHKKIAKAMEGAGKTRSAELVVEKIMGLENAKTIIKEEAERYIEDTNAGNNGWIPVEERMPEEGVDVLVWFEYFRYGNYNRLFQTTGISYAYEGEWSGFVNGSSGWQQLKVIAWQPLPAPYKEGEC